MNIRAYFKNLKWKYKPILRLKMKFGAGFKNLKWKWELILRFKMRFLAYGDPWLPLKSLEGILLAKCLALLLAWENKVKLS